MSAGRGSPCKKTRENALFAMFANRVVSIRSEEMRPTLSVRGVDESGDERNENGVLPDVCVLVPDGRLIGI